MDNRDSGLSDLPTILYLGGWRYYIGKDLLDEARLF